MLTDEERQAHQEREALIRELIQAHPKASDREIAEMVRVRFRSCSHTYVNKIRKQMEHNK